MNEDCKSAAGSWLLATGSNQNLHHSATEPQPKPLTAETAEGAEIRRKSKDMWQFFRRRNRREPRRFSLGIPFSPVFAFPAPLCALCVLCGGDFGCGPW